MVDLAAKVGLDFREALAGKAVLAVLGFKADLVVPAAKVSKVDVVANVAVQRVMAKVSRSSSDTANNTSTLY